MFPKGGQQEFFQIPELCYITGKFPWSFKEEPTNGGRRLPGLKPGGERL